jgi:hypothetical protein
MKLFCLTGNMGITILYGIEQAFIASCNWTVVEREAAAEEVAEKSCNAGENAVMRGEH